MTDTNSLFALLERGVVALESMAVSEDTIADTMVGAAVIELPLGSFTLLDGTPLAKFADGASATPGLDNTDSENLTIRWNNHATPTAVARQVGLPADLDVNYDMFFKAVVFKVGATIGDATVLTLGYLNVALGGLENADSDAGGDTGAVTGDLTSKTTQLLSRTIAHADIATPPANAFISVKPKAGLLGTDDFCISRMYIAYTRRAT